MMTPELCASNEQTDQHGEGTCVTSIALVIVCRNAIDALQQTLSSIQAIADPRVLPIIIDGASIDGTPAYLDGLGSWVYHARSEPDRGIYDAMNKGWAAAPPNSFILYLGAGDTLLELPADAGLCDPQGQPWTLILGEVDVGTMPFRSRWNSELRLRNTAHHQAMLLHKTVSPAPPFDAELRVYADWDLNLRLFRRGVIAKHNEQLRTHATPGGASWSMDVNEIHRVSRRHSGFLIGAASWALNSVSRWRRSVRLGSVSPSLSRNLAEKRFRE